MIRVTVKFSDGEIGLFIDTTSPTVDAAVREVIEILNESTDPDARIISIHIIRNKNESR